MSQRRPELEPHPLSQTHYRTGRIHWPRPEVFGEGPPAQAAETKAELAPIDPMRLIGWLDRQIAASLAVIGHPETTSTRRDFEAGQMHLASLTIHQLRIPPAAAQPEAANEKTETDNGKAG